METMPILVSGHEEDHLTSAILSLDQVVDMGDIMLRVLTTCRHRVGIGQAVYFWLSEHCTNDSKDEFCLCLCLCKLTLF